MVTEMITMKLDRKFLREIDDVVKSNGYQNRTEFIRNALREKVEEAELKKAMKEIGHLKGAGKRKNQTTDEELERIREEVFEEFDKKFR